MDIRIINHDLKKDECIILRRQMKGVSVTYWCTIGYSGSRKVFF